MNLLLPAPRVGPSRSFLPVARPFGLGAAGRTSFKIRLSRNLKPATPFSPRETGAAFIRRSVAYGPGGAGFFSPTVITAGTAGEKERRSHAH